MHCQLNRGGGEDKQGPRVFSHGKGLIEAPDEVVEVGAIRCGGHCPVCYSKGHGSAGVYRRGESKGEEAVGFAEDASRHIREGSCNGGGVLVRCSGLAGVKKFLWAPGRDGGPS